MGGYINNYDVQKKKEIIGMQLPGNGFPFLEDLTRELITVPNSAPN